jgi:hypothetical protein
VWFTGGELSPAPPRQDDSHEENSEYGSLEEWKELFGGEHKRTWKESFSVMGAKLFLGAELQDSMDSNGTMSYTLHRPYGGHGKAYVDVSDAILNMHDFRVVKTLDALCRVYVECFLTESRLKCLLSIALQVLYCDEVLLLTKGCHGSLHVTVKADFLDSVTPSSYSDLRNDTVGMMYE